MKVMYKLLLIYFFLLSGSASANSGTIIDRIKSQGHVNCGVPSSNVVGFFESNDGKYKGLDADFCRALSAAIFGNVKAVNFVQLSSKDRFEAMYSGEIDVLTRLAAARRNRDLLYDLETPVSYFIDGNGVMVHEDSEIESLKDLEGSVICKQRNNKIFEYVENFLSSRTIEYKTKSYAKSDQMKAAFIQKKCDVLITDRSLLADIRMKNPKIRNAKILDELIRVEALGPMVPYGDDTWRNVVKWVVLTTMLAEELGISSQNVDLKLKQNDHYTKLFFSGIKNYKDIGLDKDWVYRIIKLVGNYAEIYDRNFGENSRLMLNRSVNNLWLNDGLLYVPRI